MKTLCLAAALLSTPALGNSRLNAVSVDLDVDSRPIRKVVTLLTEMKQQVERNAKEDKASYDKYMCWCQTNRQEKTQAVEVAQQHISDLQTFISESAAKEGELKTEIGGLKEDIAADKDALATASSVREKEKAAFQAAEADMKETRQLLSEAMDALAGVQLVQKNGKPTADAKRVAAVLLQVQGAVQERFPQYSSVLQKDLFDMMGSFDGLLKGHLRQGAVLEQTKLLPWEKTEEQIGKEAKTNDLKGQAAGAKSYNSRSGKIHGILGEMHDEFSRDLSSAQKADLEAEVSFQNLRSAKLSEIAVASKQQKRKEAALADNLNEAAKAKSDKEATEAAVEADQGFMAILEKNCKTEDEEFTGRVAVRTEELRALGETLKILNEDVARDLYDKTMAFVQVGMSRSVAVSSAAQRVALERSARRLAEVARRHRNWALASLASRMHIDAFTKVKAVMDKMLADLVQQQQQEYSKWELCKKDIDETEDSIKEGIQTQVDLKSKHQKLSNTISLLEEEVAGLKKDVSDMEVSLKQAGEERKEQNNMFQTQVTDQRATINILKKAAARLSQFYEFNQVSSEKPGQAVAPPPPTPKDYQKSAGAGGVIQLMAMIIKDAEVAEQELVQNEQKSQEDYGLFVQGATESIQADRASIKQKEAQTAEARSEKSETEESQLANGEELAKLNDLLHAHHLECDYVLKYFDIRQKARAEEMDAIKEAKAILSGSNFGGAQ